MSVYFSEKFKQLRKKHDLTQDQIADIFHVSPKCVSRWETGTNFPDIELLPHLAIYFKITLDDLLGMDAVRNEENIKEYARDIRNLLNSGKLYDAIELGRKSMKEYPLNGDLQYHFLEALCKACSDETPGFKENTEKYRDEIITTGDRIMNTNPHDYGIKVEIIRQYVKWGMKEEAKKILDTLPGGIWDAREVWEELILEGEEWQKRQKHNIIRAKYLLEYYVGKYIAKAELSVLQKIECKKAKIQIERLIDTISEEQIEPIGVAFEYITLAELYCEAGDSENAVEYVEKATQGSMRHIEQMDKTTENGSNYMAWATPRNLPWILWEDHLSKPKFDIVRNEERFTKCFELLKANSKELK